MQFASDARLLVSYIYQDVMVYVSSQGSPHEYLPTTCHADIMLATSITTLGTLYAIAALWLDGKEMVDGRMGTPEAGV